MKNTPTGTAAVRFKPLRDWLAKHNAVGLNLGQMDYNGVGRAQLELWSVNGRTVMVLIPPDVSGWDLLVPASDKNEITATLRAAEQACGIEAAERWFPDAAHINALPEPIRRYIHDIETRCDPAGDIQTIACLRENVAALTREASDRIREAYSHLGAALMQTAPSDDQIIMGHVRSAHELLEAEVLKQ
jgi:hypothetical protein